MINESVFDHQADLGTMNVTSVMACAAEQTLSVLKEATVSPSASAATDMWETASFAEVK